MVSGHLRLIGLRKTFGQSVAVDRITLTVDRGERVALLGPSGCGKTTTLNMLAGFIAPDEGDIFLGDKKITSLPPHRRNTGMVFQQYALFPHLTVAENIAFGLRMRKVPDGPRRLRVRKALERVRLEALGDRYPQQLSGGQQQRVALARAIVLEPEILLLDEPLSNLDAKLRQEMRTEMLELLETLNITTILVTHDQEEALALAHRIAIINAGRVEQVGISSDVFESPQTAFVAKFMGDPSTLTGVIAEISENIVSCDIGDGMMIKATTNSRLSVGDTVELLIRAERVHLSGVPQVNENSIPVKVESIVYLGNTIRYILRAGSQKFAAVDQNRGDAAVSNVSPTVAHWLPKDTLAFPKLAEEE
jgi:putative spermidine/putrescine transport system ATP-binding protein